MTQPPFGFNGPPSDDDPAEDGENTPQPQNPFAFGFPGMQIPGMQGGQFPADLGALMPMIQQLQQMLNRPGSQSGPVNWDLAKQTAMHGAQSTEKPATTNASDVQQAVRIADLWLDDASSFPSGVHNSTVWTRSEWVSRTLDVWAKLCDPVAAKMVDAMTSMIPQSGLESIPGMPAIPGLGNMMQGMGGMMFGGQVGQALGQLSGEVLTSTDVGLPLGPEGTAVLVAQNVDELAASLEHDPEEVRLFLCLREAAYHRLFGHVPWLRKKLLGTIEAFASGIAIDRDAIERSLGEISPEEIQANPEKINEILSSGVFEPQETEAQKQQLLALETLLALIEGWVDHVVTRAAGDRLPNVAGLSEMMRRRRASGGPAEQTFATLVGLKLRPRRLRDATAMWARIESSDGIAGRDALWEHPDLLPTSDDFGPEQIGSDDEPRLTDADFEALLSSGGLGGPTENLSGGVIETPDQGNSGEPNSDQGDESSGPAKT